MKRKIIKQGKSTLTISLPVKWAKKFNLEPGDEIEVEDKGRELSINADKGFESQKSKIDISGRSISMVRFLLNSAYIRGDDKIKVIFDNPEQVDTVQECINFNIGMAIIDQSQKSCLIKEISESSNEELDNMLRRIFYMIQSFGEEGLELLRNNESIDDYWKRDRAINKYIYYALRILNKQGHPHFRKTKPYYDIFMLLEYLSDEYSRLYRNLEENKISKSTIGFFEEVNQMFRDFTKVFYKFNYEDADKLILKKYDIRKRLLKINKKEDLTTTYYLAKITEMIINIQQIRMQLS